MENKRLEKLQQFLQANPNDCFVRYGLAQEYGKAGQLEAAIDEYRRIFEINPDYQAAYFHAGQAYRKLGQNDQARQVFERGIETSLRTGDLHARSELEAALAEIA
ncbi:MAG: tetratricopeptide repeat protein [Acidobacteria bacterium]|nr:tetratricopeptide repeat protein [Acidobacteriota bacterium]